MLAEFISWWAARIGELLTPLSARFFAENSLLLRQTEAGGGSFEAFNCRRGQTQSLGKFRTDRAAPPP